MPIVIRNNTNSIEVDMSVNLKVTVSKGGFDVIYEDIGDGIPYVYLVIRSNTITNNTLRLDWRDCSSPDATFTSAENLRDTLTGWNIQKVSVNDSALPSGAATSENQTNGDAETQIVDDQTGKSVAVTPIRELKTISPVRLVGTVFGSAKDTNFWAETVTGSGAVAVSGQASLDTGTTADSTVKYTTVRKARFIPASANQFRAIARFTTAGTTGNTRQIGCYDANEGFFFKLSGSIFSVVSRKGTVDTAVSSGSFNGSSTTYSLDTNIHRFNIDYTNLSAQFYIDDVLIHTISSQTDPLTNYITFPITIENNNSGGLDTNIEFDVRVANIVRLGNLYSDVISKYQSGTTAGLVLKYGAGQLHGLAVSGVANNSVVTLYDNTAASGTIIWSSGAMAANTTPFSINFFKLPFSTGLTLVIGTAASNVTVIYE